MTTAEVLRAARAKIERGWCQGAIARTSRGDAVFHDSPTARSWCVAGAIRCITINDPAARAAADAEVARAVGSSYIGDWNDERGRTKEQVLAAFDGAIAAAEAGA